MSTTTIRIDDDLKRRVAAAAERVGKTTHAFILDGLSETVEHAESDAAFHVLADERWANSLATGQTVPWSAAKAWLEARSPLIGRPVKGGKRELIIGRGARGIAARYRFVASIDTVFVLAIRSQRKQGYKR